MDDIKIEANQGYLEPHILFWFEWALVVVIHDLSLYFGMYVSAYVNHRCQTICALHFLWVTLTVGQVMLGKGEASNFDSKLINFKANSIDLEIRT